MRPEAVPRGAKRHATSSRNFRSRRTAVPGKEKQKAVASLAADLRGNPSDADTERFYAPQTFHAPNTLNCTTLYR